MDAGAYLARLGLRTPPPSLPELHERHLLAVPFENLDIHAGVPIVLDERELYDKVVRRRRGGFCYELNGAFAWLLRELGHAVDLLEGQVHGEEGWGIPFDHLVLRVDGGWLADVGFGDGFVRPVPLDGSESVQRGERFRVEDGGPWRVLLREGRPQFRFRLEPRALADFEPGCRYHQTSPDSPFTQRRLCSLLTPEGRVTLRDDRRIETRGGVRTETPVAEFDAAVAVLLARDARNSSTC